ncbi:MAG TPA: copper-binding protein [Ideonella sp.]|uniref:copper-binding protein n=1 Tax=Ideonella sp. TaxID=1929293 RepID=UPI002BAF3382|nr:copper-binding protein [Ideonella sp.]HSI47952.1 copper-binding protein [Ideonella sp.]
MKPLLKLTAAALIAGSLLPISAPSFAHDEPMVPAHAEMSQGEIKNIDKDNAKLTIKHGELKNIGMPAMTMVFRVKDPAMLTQVKVGDQIHFVAEKVGGALTVTTLQVAK